MNKIKVLYEVFKIMRDSELIKGDLRVNGAKDGVSFFKLENEFEKNLKSGYTKAKINTEFNHEGKTFKHQSSSEFDMGKFPGEGYRHHGFGNHMHHPNCHGHKGFGGPLNGLSKITFLFGVLNSLKLEETEGQGTLLTLRTADFPEEIKNLFKEKMEHKNFHGDDGVNGMHEEFMGKEQHKHHELMKELHDIVDPNIELNVWINKDYEVEKILAEVCGKETEEKGSKEMNVRAELSLVK